MKEIVFEITQEADGGYVAECLTENIVTEADSWNELRRNVKEAVTAYYFDSAQKPSTIRLHLIRDEFLASREAASRPEWSRARQRALSRVCIPRRSSGKQIHCFGD